MTSDKVMLKMNSDLMDELKDPATRRKEM